MRIPLGLRAAAGNVGGPVGPTNPWDIGYASFTATPQNWFNTFGQDTAGRGLTFKPDGTKMYVIGSTGDNIYEYNLSTAWYVGSASYVQSFDVSSQETVPTGIFFKSDGTAVYIVGSDTDSVYQYSLSTAWDVSTASYVQGFSVATEEVSPNGLFFKPDGTKMYVIGQSGDDVNEYDLSTAWDISTASYLQNFSVSAKETQPSDVFFSSDGTKFYITGTSSDSVHEYSMSTAWDVSTASFSDTFNPALGNASSPQGLAFKADGTVMYLFEAGYDNVMAYDLSTAWDLTTVSFTYPTTDFYTVAAQDDQPSSLAFKGDGTRMYILGNRGDDVNEYSLSSAWNVHTASYVQSFSVNAQEATPNGLFMKPDGTKMYIVGTANDTVYQYTLSTAWDISSASYTQGFSVNAQELTPSGLTFKDDGTKMYVCGASGDDVNEYSLFTAWDISTASYVQAFSVQAQDTSPSGVFFKDDGTKMYITGTTNDILLEYSLSTAWDVSTASYVQTNTLIPWFTRLPEDLYFRPDGGKVFILDGSADSVWAFTIS
jgi:DNA-binding beta-propeller fold protein YncE